MLHERMLGERYSIRGPLGEGATSQVYLARDCALNRDVALKVLKAPVASERSAVDRFVHEARAAAGLSHPHIVGVHDIGEADGLPFVVMEYVRGGSLECRLDAGPLTETQALGYAIDILDALAYAHALGIVHRDLKPANIFLDEHNSAKLGDFGAEHAGSIAYLAPEVARGERATHAADLFSAGVVLFQMLSGRLPRPGGELPIEIRPDVAAVIEDLTRSDPRARIATAAEAAQALRAIADTRAAHAGDNPTVVLTKPLPVPPPRVHRQRRDWTLAALYVAIVLFVAIVSAVALAPTTVRTASAPVAPARPASVAVPLIVNLSSARARAEIARAHLVMKTYTRFARVPAGIVVAQYPRAGAQLPERGTVLSLISAGPPPEAHLP